MSLPTLSVAAEDIPSWKAEFTRIFTPERELHGVGTPELARLVALSNGDMTMPEFFDRLAVFYGASFPNSTDGQQGEALVRGASAWLYMPDLQASEQKDAYGRFLAKNQKTPEGAALRSREGQPMVYRNLPMRQAWAYFHFRRVLGGTVPDYQAKQGSKMRSAFRDALIDAIVALSLRVDSTGSAAATGEGGPLPGPLPLLDSVDVSAPIQHEESKQVGSSRKKRKRSKGRSKLIGAMDAKPAPRRIPARRSLTLALAFGVLVVSIAIVVWSPWSSAPQATSYNVYIPSADAVAETKSDDVAEGIQVECAMTSLTTLRKDAHLCLGVGVVLDPCFVIATEFVSCPRVLGGSLEELVYRVDRFREFTFDANQIDKQIGAEESTLQPYPWGLVLEVTGDAGVPLTCVQTWSDERFTSGAYRCNSKVAEFKIGSTTPISGEDGSDVYSLKAIVVRPEGLRSGSLLDLTDAVATLELQNDDSAKLETVRVLSVWY